MTSTTSANRLVVVNPATGEEFGTAPILSAEEVAELAARGRVAQREWEALGFDGRAVVLRRMQSWLADHANELIDVVQQETGRIFEDTALEIGYPLAALGFWADRAGKYLRDKRIPATSPLLLGKRLRSRYLPHGLVGVIAPWNFPITIGFGDSIPALAAGNAVILKPSEITPLSIEIVRRGLLECGRILF